MPTQQTYVVRRAGIAASAAELEAALMRLRDVEATAQPVQWLHSYALCEPDGRFGLACVFNAPDAAALRVHADRSRLPAQEIVPVTGTLFEQAFAPTRVYLIRRRSAWPLGADLERSGAIVRRMADEAMPRQVCWLHSYIVREDDGSLGSVCLYQGIDPEALGRHAARAGMPADEITPVLGRIVFREPSRVAA
jgi:hypothetical protein